MSGPIRASVNLRCVLRGSGFRLPEVGGVTEELTRDSAVVLLREEAAAQWVRPGCHVTLLVELPAFEGQVPRFLDCSAVVGPSWFDGGGPRIRLAITSMAFQRAS